MSLLPCSAAPWPLFGSWQMKPGSGANQGSTEAAVSWETGASNGADASSEGSSAQECSSTHLPGCSLPIISQS